MRFGILHAAVPAVALAIVICGCGKGDTKSPGGAVADSTARDAADPRGGYVAIDVAHGGTISGHVRLAGKPIVLPDFDIGANQAACAGAAQNNRLQLGKGGTIACAVVYLEGVKQGKQMPRLTDEALTIDQHGCQYEPHVLAVPVGDSVAFTNSDDVAHNVRVEDPVSDSVLLNRAQPTRGRRDRVLVAKAGPMAVECDYHPWMNAYVFGVDNPYYAVTLADGRFVIEGVPPGAYTLNMWLNGTSTRAMKDNQGRLVRYYFGEPYIQRKPVQVGPDGSVDVTFEVAVR